MKTLLLSAAVIFFLFLPLFGQETLKERVSSLDQLTALQESFRSNQNLISAYQNSNHVWAAPQVTAIIAANNEICARLLGLTNAYGNDRALISLLMQQVADWWFEKDLSRRDLALSVYRLIVGMDLDMVKEANQDVWEGRGTSLNPGAFTRALMMDRYQLESSPAFGRGDEEESSWRARYRGWHKVWTNGYSPGAEFKINMGIFYLFEGDLDRARRALGFDRFGSDSYWRTRIAAKTLQGAQGGEAWRVLKDFLSDRMVWDSLRKSPGPIQFRRAMENLEPRDLLGRALPLRFDLLPLSNETLLEGILQGLDRAAQDPVATAKARFNQGLIFLALERWPQAVRSLEAAASRSADVNVYSALALAELKLGNGNRALSWYQELTRLDANRLQNDGFLLNNMATAAVGSSLTEDRKLALSRVNRAVEIDDRNPVFHTTRAEVLFSLGDFREGSNALKRAQAMVPLAEGEGLTNTLRWFALPETNRGPGLIKELSDRIGKMLGK